jgi:thiosulfate dehydrogenase (quinone) large subunit
MHWNSRSAAYFILRLTLGFVFLMYGIGKLMEGVNEFTGGLEKQFADTFLPGTLVSLFGITLPFMEVLIGILLIAGLFTRYAIAFAGLLMVALTTGLAITGEPEGVGHNLIYSFILFGLLYYIGDNRWAFDRLFETSKHRIPVEFRHRKTA